jgi:hypothetical protein
MDETGTLEERLAPPWYDDRPLAWLLLTTGDRLFRALREAVRRREVDAARRWVEEWGLFVAQQRGYAPDQGWNPDDVPEQWERMRVLAWCAERAVHDPDCFRAGHDGGRRPRAPSLGSLERDPVWPVVARDPDWARVCMRTLLGARQRGRTVGVAAAAWDEAGGDAAAGRVVTLVLEVLECGAWQVAHHPVDHLATSVDPAFAASMEDAWEAAREQVESEGIELPPVDGRWRVLEGSLPVPLIAGRSASGAAARGWYFALRDRVPDEEVMVLAEVKRVAPEAPGPRRFVLGPVDGVRPKVRAIAADGRFDSLVVVSPGPGDPASRRDNRAEAEAALQDAPPSRGRMRIVEL